MRKTMKVSGLVILATLLLAVPILAQDSYNEKLHQALKVSGLGEQMNIAVEDFVASLNSEFGPMGLPPISKDMVEERMRESIVSNFTANFELGELDEFVRFYQTDPMPKIVKYDTESAADEVIAAYIETNPNDAEKIAEVEKMFAVAKIDQLQIEVTKLMLGSMFAVMNTMQPPEQRMSPAQIEQNVQAIFESQNMELIAREEMINAARYTYRDLSISEIKHYTAFYESALGQRTIAAMSGAMRDFFSTAGEFIASGLGEVMSQQ